MSDESKNGWVPKPTEAGYWWAIDVGVPKHIEPFVVIVEVQDDLNILCHGDDQYQAITEFFGFKKLGPDEPIPPGLLEAIKQAR